MSEQQGDNGTATPATAPTQAPPDDLARLMAASVPAPLPTAEQQDDVDALQAAELAIAAGERALAAAGAGVPEPTVRHRIYGMLLLANLLALVALTSWPMTPAAPAPGPVAPTPVLLARQAAAVAVDDALAASTRNAFGEALAAIEPALGLRDLPTSPRTQLLAMAAYYAARSGDVARARELQNSAEALVPGDQAPPELVAMADNALRRGDRAVLARTWTRFLLQQRRLPSWLEAPLASAWLGLDGLGGVDAAVDARAVRTILAANARLLDEARTR